MYAVIVTGGKQYKVALGDTVKVEKLDVEAGSKVSLKPILIAEDNSTILTGDKLAKASVECQVVENGKDAKIVVFKYKAKKNERKKQGHRQPYTLLNVLKINK